jgi:hypothetical protein
MFGSPHVLCGSCRASVLRDTVTRGAFTFVALSFSYVDAGMSIHRMQAGEYRRPFQLYNVDAVICRCSCPHLWLELITRHVLLKPTDDCFLSTLTGTCALDRASRFATQPASAPPERQSRNAERLPWKSTTKRYNEPAL